MNYPGSEGCDKQRYRPRSFGGNTDISLREVADQEVRPPVTAPQSFKVDSKPELLAISDKCLVKDQLNSGSEFNRSTISSYFTV